ncbi:GLPGLI family protein [Psychroserpens sp. SPM9]|uniref:GLPGLI family protein n=1 Tax=Psychroserpens sp. SPM9 TaxID=2975598 RepID=UPI0021A50FB2|nr:GLPGLI family protein [Psychroserpens sp. SPM9]MDG5491167.1 GLPGLI family protein [Psychroserpens sp. SPM9]
MNKYLTHVLLISIFLMSCEALFSQDISNVKVFYNKHMKSLKDTSGAAPKQLKDLSYILIANSTESTFAFEKRMDMDNFSNKRHIGRSGGDGLYYKNIKTKEKLHQKKYGGKLFLISYDVNTYNWKIHKEYKIIGKYKCYKASTSYSFHSKLMDKTYQVNITAWFTPEISVPFGPAGYDGLPGLVLEAQIGGYYFVASKIELNAKKVTIEKPEKGKKVTNKEYDDIVQNSIDN